MPFALILFIAMPIIEIAVLHLHETKVFVSTAEIWMLANGIAVVFFSFGQIAVLEVEIREDEVEGGAATFFNLWL